MKPFASLLTGLLLSITMPAVTASPGVACDQGNARACLLLGLRFMRGDDSQQSARTAQPRFEKACARQLPVACHYAGINLYRGLGDLPRNKQKAIAYLKAACNLGEYRRRSCYHAASAMLETSASGQPATRARALASEGCRHRDAGACAIAAALHGGHRGMERNVEEMLVHARAGCRLDNVTACYQVAREMGFAGDVKFEPETALAHALKAWRLRPSTSTAYLAGMTHWLRGEWQAARGYFRPACETGHEAACVAAGHAVHQSRPDRGDETVPDTSASRPPDPPPRLPEALTIQRDKVTDG